MIDSWEALKSYYQDTEKLLKLTPAKIIPFIAVYITTRRVLKMTKSPTLYFTTAIASLCFALAVVQLIDIFSNQEEDLVTESQDIFIGTMLALIPYLVRVQ